MTAAILPSNKPVQVTPDQRARKVAPLPAELTPLFAVSAWQPAGDGTYRPVAKLYERGVSTAEAEKLTGISPDTLRRLIRAGFVIGGQPTPGKFEVNLPSLMAHIEATRDPEFWTEARRQKWSEAL
jgi:hypothetical protein